MGISAVVFETAGKRTEHRKPGVYTRRNNVPGGTGTPSQSLVVLGQSIGGEPNTLLEFSDVSEARNVLIGGSLLDGVAHAFTGSKKFIPQKVYGFRVNKGTRSAITLKNGSDDVITLRSKDYGIHTNQIKIWVKDGSIPLSKRALVSYKGNNVDTGDVIKKSLSVLYTGSETTAEVSIDASGMTLTAGAESIVIDWLECETIDNLITRINDTGMFAATAIDVTPNAKTAELDAVQNVSAVGAAAVLYSNLAAFISALKLKAGQFIGEIESNSTLRLVPENTEGYEYFSGAAAGTYSISDWMESLELLEKEDVQSVTSPCDDHDVQVLIVNHCVTMSTTSKKKERQYLLGVPLGTSLEAGLALAAEFNSDFGSVVIDDAVASNPLTGSTETIPPALLACKTAGMEAALGIATPLTNKEVNVKSFGRKWSDPEFDKMIAGGIMPFGANDDGLLVVIRAMTTYQGDDLASCERSCVRESLYMDRDFRKAFNCRIGNADEPSESDVIDLLKKRAKIWKRMGMINRGDDGELVSDVKVSFDGDATFVKYGRYLRAPNNFIFGTANNKIYRSAE